MPEELWMEVHDIVQKAVIKTILQEEKWKQTNWLSEEALQKAVKGREAKGKGEKERYTHSVQSLCQLFVTPWTAARQASLSVTNSWSLLKLMSIELVKPSNHLILCCPLLLPPSIFPSIRVLSNESVLRIRWMQSSHLNAEFQRIARRDKKAFLSDQCKEIEENNRMGD